MQFRIIGIIVGEAGLIKLVKGGCVVYLWDIIKKHRVWEYYKT